MADEHVLSYYDGPDLEPVVLAALEAAGRPVDRIDSDDLAALDEFHALGRPATLALAVLAGIGDGDVVLDVGAGIGGPSRTLARHFGARVTALDPTERFCRLNRAITERAGLADRVAVVEGDALALPFGDESFDVVWTQAVWQGIEDKARVAAELQRVLKPGGRLAFFEMVSGDGGELLYPVPWADGPRESFLVGEDDLRATLRDTGLTEVAWRDREEIGAAMQQAGADSEAMSTGVPAVDLALVMPDYEARMETVVRNVAEGRIALVQALLTKPA
jgi:SAM-dependent methyltransferase